MALATDASLFYVPAEGQNNASGIISTGETLGSSLGTAIIGIILILGVMGGISTAVDTYAPDYSGDEQFHQAVYDYFQKLDTIEGQDSIVVNTADIIIQNAKNIKKQWETISHFLFFLNALGVGRNYWVLI